METLETKFAQLQLMIKRSQEVGKKSVDAIERNTTNIKLVIAEVAGAKMVEEAKRIAAKEDLEVIEKTVDKADRVVRQLKEIVEEHNEQGVRQKYEKDMEYERKHQ